MEFKSLVDASNLCTCAVAWCPALPFSWDMVGKRVELLRLIPVRGLITSFNVSGSQFYPYLSRQACLAFSHRKENSTFISESKLSIGTSSEEKPSPVIWCVHFLLVWRRREERETGEGDRVSFLSFLG